MKKHELFANYLTYVGEQKRNQFKRINLLAIDDGIDYLLETTKNLSKDEANEFIHKHHKDELTAMQLGLNMVAQSPTGEMLYKGHWCKPYEVYFAL